MRPILINKRVAKTTFQIENDVPLDHIKIEITRVGGGDIIIYPAFERDDCSVTFMWDDALHNAKKGRYQGVIRIKDCPPFCVPLHVADCSCSMGHNENGYFTTQECLECRR